MFSSLTVALPTIGADLRGSAGMLQLVVAGYGMPLRLAARRGRAGRGRGWTPPRVYCRYGRIYRGVTGVRHRPAVTGYGATAALAALAGQVLGERC